MAHKTLFYIVLCVGLFRTDAIFFSDLSFAEIIKIYAQYYNEATVSDAELSETRNIADVVQQNDNLYKNLTCLIENFLKRYVPSSMPTLAQNKWWGEGPPYVDTSIRPYEIRFNRQVIDELRARLAYRKNFTRNLEGSANTYGMNRNLLNQVLDYWLNRYDFETRERYLNRFPQYITNVQGLDIHYIHIVPPPGSKKVIPLLMIHGWPVTNREYYAVYDFLLEPKNTNFVFEIIAPSIPGYGYSQPTYKIGLAPYQVGIIFKNLMARLGHQKFYIHAGDVGLWVGSHMSTIYQEDVLGLHTTTPYSAMPQTFVKIALGALNPTSLVDSRYVNRLYPLTMTLINLIESSGFFHMHATRPDTLGVGLEDSPSGLAAWLLAIYIQAANPNALKRDDGNLLQAYNIDDILDVLTIYWDSHCITTSLRFYAEFTAVLQDPTNIKLELTPTQVPYGALKFRYEVLYQPDSLLKNKYPNLVHSTTLDFGGHFSSFEYPDVIANSIYQAVEKMQNFYRTKAG
ncbi:Juvenile hormone epoxide hydrolase [Eumeta japonica]|uniref:microsomal epoxide hydrolase n=1 Tax=Eumeta variegata TaxID=151549 RepID=A0A4C1VW84_EUMVA|nr:Juvenile hormone epoxide hydrolase [Eumeta japonica]